MVLLLLKYFPLFLMTLICTFLRGWIYDYFTHNREARLITGTFKMRVRDPRGAPRQESQPVQHV